MNNIHHIEGVYQLHKALGLSEPMHPLISIVDFADTHDGYSAYGHLLSVDMYAVILKNQLPGEMSYGRKKYDFQEGTLMLLAPGQVLSIQSSGTEYLNLEGWGLFFHPDFLLRSELHTSIREFNFFSYDLNESLHLSGKEKAILSDSVKRIGDELSNNLDATSHTLMVSNIELMLNYCKRFYLRQFITRAQFDVGYIAQFKKLLSAYFEKEMQREHGIPEVRYFADQLHLSPKYFSDLVRNETGHNAQSIIHEHILELAKGQLVNSQDTISEVAFSLGFDYPQYFSRMFKKLTGMSPVAFRNIN